MRMILKVISVSFVIVLAGVSSGCSKAPQTFDLDGVSFQTYLDQAMGTAEDVKSTAASKSNSVLTNIKYVKTAGVNHLEEFVNKRNANKLVTQLEKEEKELDTLMETGFGTIVKSQYKESLRRIIAHCESEFFKKENTSTYEACLKLNVTKLDKMIYSSYDHLTFYNNLYKTNS